MRKIIKKQNYKGHECFAYKDVIIDNKKYIVIIEDMKFESLSYTCYDGYSNTIMSVEYLCSMFDNEDNLIYNKSIYKREEKKYLDVIKEFCSNYSIEQEELQKTLQEEQRALEELEQWDGVFNIE